MDNLTKGALGATIVVMLGAVGFAVNSAVKSDKLQQKVVEIEQQSKAEQKKREDEKAADLERRLAEAQLAQAAGQEQMKAQLDALREQMAATAQSAEEERRIIEQERAALSQTIDEKVRKDEAEVASTMTALQKKIREAAAIGKVEQVHDELGFVIINAGSSNGVQPEQRYNIRRDMFLVGELVIATVEDEKHSVGNIVAGSTQPGLSIRPGDEIIGEVF